MNRMPVLFEDIRRLIKLYDNMLKPICADYGLTPIEATIISFLYNHPGRDTAADISELRMLSKSNVSQAVEGLIRKSLLQRRQDTEDRRRIHLLLTEAAGPVTEEIERIRQRFLSQVFQGFTAGEKEQFAMFHDRIAKNIDMAAEGKE